MVSLAEVLLRHWPEYERQFGPQILPSHRRAVQAILRCRTRALGGEVYRCADCGRDHFVYHSCHHRACPQCGQAETAQWLEHQKLKLLPVPYYLITFTVPAGLRPWLRSHQQTGYGLLLKESAGALQDVARRPKYLGAELGCLSVLHTWGRQLQFHPHVHCVVPAGGLRPDGLRWCRPKSADFFLPHKVLAAHFRTRLKSALQGQPQAASIPPQLWHQNWVVDVQPAGTGQPALVYLSAYVFCTALRSQRILADQEGQITLQYRQSRDRQWRTLQLDAWEFLRRFLQHVLPKGFQRVRYYGWLSAAAAQRWQRLLALLDWKPPSPPPLPARALLCPHCGAPLHWIATLVRAPP